jgi:hypothetical protein
VSFRDDLVSDVDDVFLNSEEFAVSIDVNGQSVLAVIDDSYAPFSAGRSDSFTDASGLGLEQEMRTIWIQDDLEDDLSPEQSVTVDGESWIVRSVKVEDGVLRIEMSRGFA